jgi:hypothetical protein
MTAHRRDDDVWGVESVLDEATGHDAGFVKG